jgi:hypothetical protein
MLGVEAKGSTFIGRRAAMERMVNEERTETTETTVDGTSPNNGDQERQNSIRTAPIEATSLKEPTGNGSNRVKSEEFITARAQMSDEGARDTDQSEVEGELLRKKTERVQAQTALDRSISQRRQRLLLGGSYFLLVEGVGLWLLRHPETLGISSQTATLLDFCATFIIVPALLFLTQMPVNDAREKLRRIDQDLDIIRLRNTKERITYYGEKLYRLTAQRIATSFFDEDRRRNVASLEIEATQSVNNLSESSSRQDLSRAGSNLSEFESLIEQERLAHRDQRLWNYFTIVVVLIYIALIVAGIAFAEALKKIPTVFNIPQEIFMWAAAGSLAAILYKFYTKQDRVNFQYEVRWLIARPMIGIIMGAVAYVGVLSGLILLNAANNAVPAPGPSEPVGRAYCIVAFLAGFSDKFYMGVINLLVSKTTLSNEGPAGVRGDGKAAQGTDGKGGTVETAQPG